jgi:carbamate kinase
MQPKIDGAIAFVAATGGRAGIGALADAPAILNGTAGTIVHPDVSRGGRQ